MPKVKSHTTIEEDLLVLQQQGKDKALSIKEILDILSKKGHLLTILVLNLPFCQPLQIPGMSVPFGLAIAFLALKLVFGKYAWLPKKIQAKVIPSNTLQKITKKTLWMLSKIKRWTYPRVTLLCDHPIAQVINGLLIFILGICLAMPLPIPFSNLVVSWAILFIGLGSLKNDGIMVLIGYLVSLFAFVFFAVTILINWKILTAIF